jgi:hypothetical protein
MYRTPGRRPQDAARHRAARIAHLAAIAAVAIVAGSLLLVVVLAGCGPLAGHGASAAAGPGTRPAIPVGSSSHAISVGGSPKEACTQTRRPPC